MAELILGNMNNELNEKDASAIGETPIMVTFRGEALAQLRKLKKFFQVSGEAEALNRAIGLMLRIIEDRNKLSK